MATTELIFSSRRSIPDYKGLLNRFSHLFLCFSLVLALTHGWAGVDAKTSSQQISRVIASTVSSSIRDQVTAGRSLSLGYSRKTSIAASVRDFTVSDLPAAFERQDSSSRASCPQTISFTETPGEPIPVDIIPDVSIIPYKVGKVTINGDKCEANEIVGSGIIGLAQLSSFRGNATPEIGSDGDKLLRQTDALLVINIAQIMCGSTFRWGEGVSFLILGDKTAQHRGLRIPAGRKTLIFDEDENVDGSCNDFLLSDISPAGPTPASSPNGGGPPTTRASPSPSPSPPKKGWNCRWSRSWGHRCSWRGSRWWHILFS